MHESFWAVNANWNADNGGWNVEANSVENPNRWNDGNQVLSRYSLLSPPPPLFFRGRGFCKNAAVPATKHAADLFNASSNLFKLFVRNKTDFPRKLHEKSN